jgi:hypothetical protein
MKSIAIPSLKIDKVLYKDGQIPPRGKIERRVFANLIDHLQKNGFTLKSVWDGETDTATATIKDAMEVAFNLDQCHLYMANAKGQQHWVFFVFGNDGWDAISDWSYATDDADGFNKAMEGFEAEDFA